MSCKNILLLTLFISFYFAQAEVIHGIEIPDLNMQRILGKWYVVFGPSDDRYIACMALSVEQPTDDTVKLTAKVTPTPEGIALKRAYNEEPLLAPMTCTFVENSHILNCSNVHNEKVAVVVFDTDYDSYMAAYLGMTKEGLISQRHSDIFLLSRTLTLPSDIVDEVRKTDFYRYRNFPRYEVFHPDTSCLL